uniref:Uncharacterized protein n=1 Tax=Rhipicephalus zambeziensis TaxID=60191 RepID=A0A224YKU6_9ACAR
MTASSLSSVNLPVPKRTDLRPKIQLLQHYKYAQCLASCWALTQLSNSMTTSTIVVDTSLTIDTVYITIHQESPMKKAHNLTIEKCRLQGKQNPIHKACDTQACSAIF